MATLWIGWSAVAVLLWVCGMRSSHAVYRVLFGPILLRWWVILVLPLLMVYWLLCVPGAA